MRSKQLVRKAASGDIKATGMLLHDERIRQAPAAPGALVLDALERPEDRLVIDSIVRRIRQMEEPTSGDASSGQQRPRDEGTAATPESHKSGEHLL